MKKAYKMVKETHIKSQLRPSFTVCQKWIRPCSNKKTTHSKCQLLRISSSGHWKLTGTNPILTSITEISKIRWTKSCLVEKVARRLTCRNMLQLRERWSKSHNRRWIHMQWASKIILRHHLSTWLQPRKESVSLILISIRSKRQSTKMNSLRERQSVEKIKWRKFSFKWL